MTWTVFEKRLYDGTRFPSAQEIWNKYFGGDEDIINTGIRFSRIGGRLVVRSSFEKDSKSVLLEICAERAGKLYELPFHNGDLADSAVLDGTWRSLLSNHEETDQFLRSSGITRSGQISLEQYIRMKATVRQYSSVEFMDEAENDLTNHPLGGENGVQPASLNAILYPYQQTGFQWLKFIADSGIGCILGDEMGLGKTLQVIALIVDRRQSATEPALVIAPVSLLENWKREISRFTTGISAFIHHGQNRTGLYKKFREYDVVIISYATASSDLSMLQMIQWDMIAVDEAQNIKNPSAIRTRSIKQLKAKTRIAVTGTPFENHMSDLWSIMDFALPGCLGTLPSFNEIYPDDVYGAKRLEPVITPLIMRRMVTDVAQDLPDRIDIPQVLTMSFVDAQLYEMQRQEILKEYEGRNPALPMLQKLRMFCTHPMLLMGNGTEDPAEISGKYQRLCELLEEIISLEEKTILFTSYNKMFEILERDIPNRFGIRVLAINGSTPVIDRQRIVDDFSAIQGSALLVLNPRAAGTGLNITAATRVIHYNLEWNPAIEDQASARAYRRGQMNTVFVYRLFYKDTVEEVINERIEKKRAMSGAAVIGVDGTKENTEDIIKAISLTPKGDLL